MLTFTPMRPMAVIVLAAGFVQAHPAGHGNHEAELAQQERQQDRRPRQMEAAELPAPEVSITIEGDHRVIRSNGLPAHETGAFPNQGNPNALRAQTHEYRVPLHPKVAAQPTPARPEFGIGVNGVVFDSGTGEFWTASSPRTFGGGSEWNYEALGGGVPLGLDMNHAHVQPTGKYHYHGVPTGLLDELVSHDHEHNHEHSGDAHSHAVMERMIQIGWAFDGFPIYGPYGYTDANDANSQVHKLRSSYQLKEGERPTPPDGPGKAYDGTFGADYEYVEGSGDLDECNGRFGVTPEFPEGTYYYVVTEEFPSIPRMWRGTPDESIRSRRGGPPPGGENGERPRGQRRGERGQRPPQGRRPDR